jgi:hypothetical protein
MNALIMHFETRFSLFVLRRIPAASAQWHRLDYLQAINSTALLHALAHACEQMASAAINII